MVFAKCGQSGLPYSCQDCSVQKLYPTLFFQARREHAFRPVGQVHLCVQGSSCPPLGLDLVRLASLKWSTLFSPGPAVLTLRFTSPEPLWDYTSQPRRHTSFSYSNRSQTSLAESLYNLIGDEVEKRSRRKGLGSMLEALLGRGEVGAVEPSPIAKGIKLILPAWGLYGWLNGRELTVEVEK